MRTKDGCLESLTSAGFELVSFNALDTPTAFFNKQELVDWMVGTVAANWQVPIEIAEAFFNDLTDRMAELDHNVKNESGAYYMKLSRFEVIAQPFK